jgi:hypothetical protein
MHDATIAEIERWLRECARMSERPERNETEGAAAADPTDTAPDQDRPFWPYLESEDFWRE